MEEYKEDMLYLLKEMTSVISNYKNDIPEEMYKVLSDLIYHSNNTVKEMYKEYERSFETWFDSLCKISGFRE